jgi:putative hydrolase of the HAD superfamily
MLIDLDGTVIDNRLTAEEAWRSVCCEAGPVLGVAADQLQSAIATAADWFWADPRRGREGRIDLVAATRRIVERAFLALGAGTVELAAQIGTGFRERRDEFVMLPGSIEALDALSSHGIDLALITNGAGAVQREKIERFGLTRFFRHIFIEGELEFGKPDERVYRHAVATLGAQLAGTWIVGDDLEWEVAAPQRLGMYAIWMDARGRGLPPDSAVRPDRVIRSLSELAPRA